MHAVVFVGLVEGSFISTWWHVGSEDYQDARLTRRQSLGACAQRFAAARQQGLQTAAARSHFDVHGRFSVLGIL